MKSNTNLSIFVMAAALCAAATIVTTNAQDVPPCASKLVACVPYLNSTSKPSMACCFPLKTIIDDDFQCLCELYKTAEFSGGNVTQAMTLPARCGFTTDLSVCAPAPPPGPSTSPSPTGTPGSPPTSGTGTPPTGGPGAKSPPSGAVKSIAPAAGFLLLISFWVSMFLN